MYVNTTHAKLVLLAGPCCAIGRQFQSPCQSSKIGCMFGTTQFCRRVAALHVAGWRGHILHTQTWCLPTPSCALPGAGAGPTGAGQGRADNAISRLHGTTMLAKAAAAARGTLTLATSRGLSCHYKAGRVLIMLFKLTRLEYLHGVHIQN